VFPPEINVYNDDELVGKIYFYTQKKEMREILKDGNKLQIPSFVIRDMKTNLIIGTNKSEFSYK
jgi:hypothetical protein